MKKRDIIQLVKETVKENTFFGNREQPSQLSTGTKASVPTDEYPFSKRPKRTATGMMEAGPSNNPYYNNLVKKAKEMGIHVNDLMKDLLKDKSEMEIVKMGYQDLAALAGVENLSESQGTLSSDMLNYADQYHMELVDTMKGVSTHPDKRTGGFRILFPHENGPGPGALFGKEVRMQIEKSKAAAKAAALKTVSKFQDQIEDYEISDSSPAGVHGSIHLWVMPKNNMNEEINEAHPLNKVIGGYPVKYEGDPNNYRAIISEPMDDRQKEAMIVRAKEAGYIAKPNMGGGITIFVKESIKESPMFRTGIKQDMAPKEMAGRIKSVFDKVNGAKDPVKTPEWHKNRFKNKYGISFPETLKGINKDQALAMNKYANDMKITEADTKTYAGVDSVTSMKKDPRYGTLSGDAKVDLEKKLKDGGAVELEEDMDNPDDSYLELNSYYIDQIKRDLEELDDKEANKFLEDLSKAILTLKRLDEDSDLEEIGMFHDPLGYEPEDMDNPDEDLVIIGSGYLDIKSKFGERPSQTNGEYAELGQKVVDQLHNGDKDAALDYIYSQINENRSTNMMEAYIKERGNDNLMEHVDRYKKRAVLMEGAMKKFFEMFDQGKTDEEIVQDYAQKGTTVPEPFVTKARRQYEGMKKLKLELEMSEKEFRNSSEKMVNNAEEGMEYEGEEKTLASGLTNEEPNEGNAFGLAMQKAKEAGEDSFELDGETFKVEK